MDRPHDLHRQPALRTALLLILAVTLVSALVWVLRDPQAWNWDEARYLNQVTADYYTFRNEGPRAYLASFFTVESSRPPAHRILAAPFSLAFGVLPVTPFRLLALAAFGASLLLLFHSTARLADPWSRLASVLVAALFPAVLNGFKTFGTEFTSSLAVSGSLFFLLRDWDRDTKSSGGWIGLGLALALGAWAKLSFLGVVLPMLACAWLLGTFGWIHQPRPMDIVKACALGLLLALPWYALNGPAALEYTGYSLEYVRASLGASIWRRLWNWPAAFAQFAIGLPMAAALLGLTAYALIGFRKGPARRVARPVLAALLVCAAGFVPAFVLQVASQNQSMRLLAPALMPLGAAAGIFLGTTRLLRFRYAAVALVALAALQLGAMFTTSGMVPGLSSTFEATDRWDWEQLRAAAIRHGTPTPGIAYLGNGNLCNPAQIRAPWANRDERVNIVWLWRFEYGDIHWRKTMESLGEYDLVFTLPGYQGNPASRQDLDNVHNREFLDRLRADERFGHPITLHMGRDRVPVVVYFKLQ